MSDFECFRCKGSGVIHAHDEDTFEVYVMVDSLKDESTENLNNIAELAMRKCKVTKGKRPHIKKIILEAFNIIKDVT